MVKLKRIFLSPPHMGGEEMRFVQEAFESNYIAPLGPQVDAFEKEFAEKIGISYAVALSSGTAAMHLALHQIGVREGDEVIVSTLTFIGSVSPVTFLGGKPVFIDADYATWNMNPGLLAEEINFCDKKGKLPKAVIPTDLYGQCADLDRILEVCEPYGIPVVVDAAEALGAKCLTQRRKGAKVKNSTEITQRRKGANRDDNKAEGWVHAGKGAKAAVFSFNGNKIITTSGGGMLVSDDETFIEQARFLSQQARDDAPHYEHSQIGFNYRMSNILAAIGRGQLKVLGDRVEAKRQIFEKYKEALKDIDGIEFMPEAAYGRSNRWLTVILITSDKFGVDRETVRLALETENIEAKPVWKPMHLQPVFDCGSRFKVQGSEIMQGKATTKIQNSKFKIQNYPARVVGGRVAEDLFKRGLCLPSGTAITDEDIGRVVSVILSCREKR